MKKIVFFIIVISVSFAAGYSTANYKITDYIVTKSGDENVCLYLRNHRSAGSENECPYLKNNRSQLGKCPYLGNEEAVTPKECPYLRGKANKSAVQEKVKKIQMRSI